MTISKSNIEATMLDYLEGNLDPLLSAELMAFLAENPEYENLLSDYRDGIVSEDTRQFEGKHLLKKDFSDLPFISPENFDEFCIASAEGLLGEDDTTRLAEYVNQHPEKQQDATLYRHLKLKPDLSIMFTGKNRLKRTVALPARLRYMVFAMGIAATIALLVTLALVISTEPPVPEYSDAFAPAKSPAVVSLPAPSATVQVIAETPEIKHKHTIPAVVKSENIIIEIRKPPREEQQISSIRPRNAVIENAHIPPPLMINLSALNQPVPAPGRKTVPEGGEDQGFSLGTLASKLNFWKAAETVVTGFNYLTESQFSLTRTLDENGKVQGLALGMEDYSISGNKIK